MLKMLLMFFLVFALSLAYAPAELAPAETVDQVSCAEADLVPALGIDVAPAALLSAAGTRQYTLMVAVSDSLTLSKTYTRFVDRGQVRYPLLI